MTEIDTQIPYIQVHRNVARLAAALAPTLAVSYQHVRGALDVFWESLADRRILTKALELKEPMVVLDETEAVNRLWLAFGIKLDPSIMVAAGVLEALPAGKYRARGMSRYIEMEAERLAELERNRSGGRSRSQAKRGVDGKYSAPTVTAPSVDRRLDSGWAPAGLRLDDPTSQQPASDQPQASQQPASSQVRGERREVRDETREVILNSSTPADGFWVWAQELRVHAGCVREAPPEPRNLSGWYSAAMMELNGDDGRLREGWLRFGDDPHWQKATPACPFKAFMNAETGWRRFVPRQRAS